MDIYRKVNLFHSDFRHHMLHNGQHRHEQPPCSSWCIWVNHIAHDLKDLNGASTGRSWFINDPVSFGLYLDMLLWDEFLLPLGDFPRQYDRWIEICNFHFLRNAAGVDAVEFFYGQHSFHECGKPRRQTVCDEYILHMDKRLRHVYDGDTRQR